LRKAEPRQLSLAIADSPSGSGIAEPTDASERRSMLPHKARNRKTNGSATGAADTSQLLEEVASEANLATALLNVVRNKGAPGLDGQTVDMAEAKATSIIGRRLRRELLNGKYRPGDVRWVWLPKPGGGRRGSVFQTSWIESFNRRFFKYWNRSSSQSSTTVATGSVRNGVLSPLLSNIVLDELDRELARRDFALFDTPMIVISLCGAHERDNESCHRSENSCDGECGCRSTRKRVACARQMKCTFLGSASAARGEKATTWPFFSPGRRSKDYAPKCGR
jgi:hypothetical protein